MRVCRLEAFCADAELLSTRVTPALLFQAGAAASPNATLSEIEPDMSGVYPRAPPPPVHYTPLLLLLIRSSSHCTTHYSKAKERWRVKNVDSDELFAQVTTYLSSPHPASCLASHQASYPAFSSLESCLLFSLLSRIL